jgi:tRNA-splicing ligase RtcB
MIHSGSRNLGKQVADHYNLVAEQLNKRWLSNIPLEWELAFLPIESQEAKNYIDEMQYCVDFALNNRMLMMNRIMTVISSIYPKMSIEPILNIAHNYAVWENHFGENVVVHRKSATLARKGMIGIIPGSQGSKSYIVRGLGNPDSFESCSHGAGRAMGRKEAERILDLAAEIKKLDDQGIIHSIRNKEDLAEATGGYKDIDIVMNNQKDLVEILVELSPIGVIKAPVNKRKHRNDKSE